MLEPAEPSVPGGLRIELSNGPGHAPGEHATEGTSSSGLGIIGVRERIEAIGGTLTAVSAPDGGFRLCAVLPVFMLFPWHEARTSMQRNERMKRASGKRGGSLALRKLA